MRVLTEREASPLLEHGNWPPTVITQARADLAAHGYVFVASGAVFVPHPTPAFAPEDYPQRVTAWAQAQAG